MKLSRESSQVTVTVLVILIIFLVMVTAGGCSNMGDAAGINLCLADFIKAYQTKDINRLKVCLDEESSFYSELVINAQKTFARYEKIDMEFSHISTNVYEDGTRATVTLKETFSGTGADGEATEEIKSGDIFEMTKSATDWKITSWYRDIDMRELPDD